MKRLTLSVTLAVFLLAGSVFAGQSVPSPEPPPAPTVRLAPNTSTPASHKAERGGRLTFPEVLQLLLSGVLGNLP